MRLDTTLHRFLVPKFKYVCMPFGLKNAPVIFQSVLEGELRSACDVASNTQFTWEAHLVNLEGVSKCLNKYLITGNMYI